MDKHYSADLSIAVKDGPSVESKTYVDGDKMRSDVAMNGMAMEIIVRKDTKKIYQIMVAQKMAMEMAQRFCPQARPFLPIATSNSFVAGCHS